MKIERVVIDTNVLISAALLDESTPARARNHAVRSAQLIGTDATVREFVDRVLSPKVDAFASRAARELLVRKLQPIIEIVPVIQVIRACRDPKDDKFLEAAVNGRADVIITGDRDLLVLHPFGGVDIITPTDYLGRFEQPR